jgi:hypothetical protein
VKGTEWIVYILGRKDWDACGFGCMGLGYDAFKEGYEGRGSLAFELYSDNFID